MTDKDRMRDRQKHLETYGNSRDRERETETAGFLCLVAGRDRQRGLAAREISLSIAAAPSLSPCNSNHEETQPGMRLSSSLSPLQPLSVSLSLCLWDSREVLREKRDRERETQTGRLTSEEPERENRRAHRDGGRQR